MEFPITDIVFYAFSFVLVAAALAVITARNPVHSVFFLIVAFFNAAGLFVLLGAEYIAMTLVIVYVGAVAVLFLFVVMMLNINFEKFRAGFIKHLPLGFGVAALLFIQIGALLYQSLFTQAPVALAAMPIPNVAQTTNAEAVGLSLYTHYAALFQLAGVILLVAMIGAIVLTLRQREGVRKQRIYTQNTRKKADSIEIVKRQPGQGA
ncbi:MAG: NADH-quinone oxidoreductase subunit J [Alphaproteobacteria bacterium]|nr:NADH-quinone oxidoreductase subunit J [Alphaproteobacteria bacterium]